MIIKTLTTVTGRIIDIVAIDKKYAVKMDDHFQGYFKTLRGAKREVKRLERRF